MHCAPLPEVEVRRLLVALRGHERFVWLDTSRPDPENRRSLLFCEPRHWLRFCVGDDIDEFFAALERYRSAGFYLAGWFAYEFGYLLEPVLAGRLPVGPDACLAEIGVFEQPYMYCHDRRTFLHDRSWPLADTDDVGDYRIEDCRVTESRERYREAIAAIHRYIAAGDTYQVNYTTRLRFSFAGRPEALYCALRAGQSVGYSACIRSGSRWILSLSPELFFRVRDRVLTARPMKGTMRRGPTAEADARLVDFLRSDIKNRSENVMIVDLLRNDLGRIALPASVRVPALFSVETYETLHQMTSTVEARLAGTPRLADLFRALFPCGSVTGAPKIRTMEIIRELEHSPRGVYTGAIGCVAPDGDMVFNVPIRTVVLDGDRGEMGIGSGIVIDSDGDEEWRECLLKGRFLTEPLPPFALIETMYWDEEGYWLVDYHWERLAASARFFGFALDEAALDGRLRELAEHLRREGGGHRVRLLVAKDGNITLEHRPCPPPARDFAAVLDRPPTERVCLADRSVDSSDIFLYHKTSRRQRYDDAWRAAQGVGYLDCLFVNERGEITEGCISTVFVRFGDRLVTPPVSCGLLPGTFRRYVLERAPLPVEEKVVTPADLTAADHVYIGNSVRGLIPVTVEEGTGPP